MRERSESERMHQREEHEMARLAILEKARMQEKEFM